MELAREITDAVTEATGMPRDMAVDLVAEFNGQYQLQRRKNAVRDVGGGIGLVVLGLLITIGSWYWAGPGGTYIAANGLIILGGLYALWGVFKTMISYSGMASAMKWFVSYAVILGLLGWGTVEIMSRTVSAAVPDNSKVQWEQSEFKRTGRMQPVRVNGVVTNLDDTWSIYDATIEITQLYRSGEEVARKEEVLVTPEVIGPGRKGRYRHEFMAERGVVEFDSEISWLWGQR